VAPWSRRGLVALGLSGGLLPSPSAFLILVSGILTGRTAYALILVLCFAIGLAGTLTAVGLLVIKGSTLLTDSAHRSSRLSLLTRGIPLIAALGVTLGGLVYLVVGLNSVAGAS
jgi:ABC-type nickel/cobalt efflux system permease component RcnA